MNEKPLETFILLVLYGLTKDGYLDTPSNIFAELSENLIKDFIGNKEKVKNYFKINYHKVFNQDNRFQSIYVTDNLGYIEFLKRDRRDYLEKIIRNVLINIFTALYTISQNYLYSSEIETLSKEKTIMLLKSLGAPNEIIRLPLVMQRRILALLVRFYKRKGSHYIYKTLKSVIDENLNISEIYAFVPFNSNVDRIEFEYYDEELDKWINITDPNLYDIDPKSFTDLERFLR